jgi:hypothetical protein
VKNSETKERIAFHCGVNYMHQKKVYECVESFKTVYVDAHCVLLSTGTCVNVMELIGQCIRSISIYEISEANINLERIDALLKCRF